MCELSPLLQSMVRITYHELIMIFNDLFKDLFMTYFRAEEGECTFNPEYMRGACPESCGYCQFGKLHI